MEGEGLKEIRDELERFIDKWNDKWLETRGKAIELEGLHYYQEANFVDERGAGIMAVLTDLQKLFCKHFEV